MALKPYFVFVLDAQYYAVAVHTVRQVVRAVKLTVLAKGPHLLAGILNYHGQIIPVVNVRKQLNLPEQRIRINDRIIIIETLSHVAAFVADEVVGVFSMDPDATLSAGAIYPELAAFVTGVSRVDKKTVLIYDTDKLLPPRELDAIAAEIAGPGAPL